MNVSTTEITVPCWATWLAYLAYC